MRTVAALLLAVVVAGCSAAASPSPSASVAPSAPASPGAIPDPLPAEVVVTFQVVEETFKALVTGEANVRHAYELWGGATEQALPIGTVVRDDAGVNAPWTWHLDPATFEWADLAVEVCDGLPSYVEDGTVTSDQYCPWSAKVIDVAMP